MGDDYFDELQRNFNLLRELDNRAQMLVTSIEERLKVLMHPDHTKASEGGRNSISLERLKQDCKRALEHAEEKVSLAAHAHETVERYLKNLDDDLARYEHTLQTKLDLDALKAARRHRKVEEREAKKARKLEAEEASEKTLGKSLFSQGAAEETYCICKRVSFGQMIACDDPHCKIEWFHTGCVGLTAIPSGKWYCNDCATRRRR